MGCKIDTALAPNGEPSKLYAQFSSYYGAEVGLMAYLHAESPLFLNKYGNTAKDKNGEYNWKNVLASMQENESTKVENIVEKANGLRKANNERVTFNEATAMNKAKMINDVLKKDGMPFAANIETDINGNYIVAIVEVSETNMAQKVNSPLDDDTTQEDESFIDDIIYQDAMERDSDIYIQPEDDLHRGDSYEERTKKKKEEIIKKNHKFRNLIKSIRLQRKALEKRMARVDKALDRALKAGDKQKAAELKRRAATMNVEIQGLIEQENEVFQMKSLTKVIDIANTDMRNIQAQISNIPNMEIDELTNLKRTLEFWIASGSFDGNKEHILFTRMELKNAKMRGLFAKYRHAAEPILAMINKQLGDKVETFLKEQIGPENVNMTDVMKLRQDINMAHAQMYDISRTDNVIFQAIFKAVTKAKQRAQMETDKLVAEIDEMMPAVFEQLQSLTTKGENPFDYFQQKDKDGNKTGSMVTQVSVDFHRERQAKYRDVMTNKSSTRREKTKARKWKKDNEIFFDVRMLYPNHPLNTGKLKGKFTDKDKAKHIAELEKNLGKDEVDKILKELDKKMLDYEIARDAFKEELEVGKNKKNSSSKKQELILWEKENSPFWAGVKNSSNSPVTHKGKYVKNKSGKYTVSMPRKFNSDGSKTAWYDSRYDEIQNNPDLKKFYDYYVETMTKLNTYLPVNQRYKMKNNSIFYVQKSINEMAMTNGTSKVSAWAKESLAMAQEAMRAPDNSTTTGTNRNLVTGEQIREVTANFVNDGKGEMIALTNQKILEWEIKHPTEKISDKVKRKLRYDAMNEVANNKSFDLSHALKSYAMLANAFHFKASIEDQVHLAYETFKQIEEGVTNSAGRQMSDEFEQEDSEKGLSQMKKQLDHFLDDYNNYSTTKSVPVAKKLYTKEEKKRLAELEKAKVDLKKILDDKKITKRKYKMMLEEIEEAIEKIGGNLDVAGIGDNVLKFIQLKGMGLNVPAAIVNVMFGQASNFIEGMSGRFFAPKVFRKAWKAANPWGKQHKKGLALATKWNIISSNLDSLRRGGSSGFLGREIKPGQQDKLDPYYVGQAAENSNQIPLVVAKAMDTMIKDKDGVEHTLWDALDDSGNLLPEFLEGEQGEENKLNWQNDTSALVGNDKLHEFVTATKQIIKKVHGNYDVNSPVLAKRTIIGKAALQFRSWLAEAIANRFEKEKYDAALGMRRKGRYRVFWDGGTTEDGGKLGGIDMLFTEGGNILKAFAGMGYDNPNNLSEIDVQAMREIAAELQMIGATFALGLVFGVIGRGIDDENDWRFMASNFMANTMNRVNSDLVAFLSPAWPIQFIDKPMASLSIWNDTKSTFHSAARLLTGDVFIESGVNAGRVRVVKDIMNLLPGGAQVEKIRGQINQIYEQPLSFTTPMEKAIAEWLF